MNLTTKETENLIFDCIDQIRGATMSAKLGLDRGQIVMTLVSHNTELAGDDISLGKLSIICDFVISAFQLGYFPEIYKKMQSNQEDFAEVIRRFNANLTQSGERTI